MAFTYDPTLISPADGSSPSNVRFLLQDVESAAPEFDDETIAAVYADRPADEDTEVKVYRTAGILAAAKARYYGRVGGITTGGTTIDVKSVKASWEEVAASCIQMADYIENAYSMRVVQGAREDYHSWGGSAIGGDGWVL